MPAPAEILETVRLESTDVTATLRVSERRAALELFGAGGHLLLFVATANQLEPPGMRGAWSLPGAASRRVLIAVGMVAPDAPLPLMGFWHRRHPVRSRLHRLGPFWLAEAAGPGLRFVVDDGMYISTARARRRPGPLLLRRQISRQRPNVSLPFPRTAEESR
jgi:hypothetical protein